MTSPEKALTARIRELRRRHFGARGKTQFADRLGITVDEYEPYEKSALPPGELMVRMCELTGEDLQWLLTGTPASGTVVISGARHRHRHLLARIAQALDAEPKYAASLEAFLELLVRGDGGEPAATALPHGAATGWIPVFALADTPAQLPTSNGEDPSRALVERVQQQELSRATLFAGYLNEPDQAGEQPGRRRVEWFDLESGEGPLEACIRDEQLSRCFPHAFGVLWRDDSMQPMFDPGDALLVCPGVEPRLGAPAFCRLSDDEPGRCRIWLGSDDQTVQLGRVQDGATEQIARAELGWALEVIYRVARAA